VPHGSNEELDRDLPESDLLDASNASSEFAPSDKIAVSWFSVQYKAYPFSKLPPKRNLTRSKGKNSSDASLLTDQILYDCSEEYVVPEFLRCDMVQQCENGRDEAYPCPYHNERCGPGWIPFGDVTAPRCLQLTYRHSCTDFTLYDNARSCAFNFADGDRLRWKTKSGGWVLPAVLTSRKDKELVAAIAARAGFDEVYLSLYPNLEITDHVGYPPDYRRLLASWTVPDISTVPFFQLGPLGPWQGLSLGSIAFFEYWDFEEPLLALQGPGRKCSVLKLSPYVHVRPVSCNRKARHTLACVKVFQELERVRVTPRVIFPPLPQSGGFANDSQRGAQYLSEGNAVNAEENNVNPAPQFPFAVKRCDDGSFTHAFEVCFAFEPNHTTIALPSQKVRRLFRCDNTSISYTLTCDERNDCGTDTPADEGSCSYQMRPVAADECQQCNVGQDRYFQLGCFKRDRHGSREPQCLQCSRSDEAFRPSHGCLPQYFRQQGLLHKYLDTNNSLNDDLDDESDDDGIVRVAWERDRKHNSRLSKVLSFQDFIPHIDYINSSLCPETHYKCPRGLCIPSFLLNNGGQDCGYPYMDDESVPPEGIVFLMKMINVRSKRSYRYVDKRPSVETPAVPCPGYFRCTSSAQCLHPLYVCDGVPHCPQQEDETYCQPGCPQQCTCIGYEFFCTEDLDLQLYPMLRYLDLSHVYKPRLAELWHAENLRFLNLSSCHLSSDIIFPQLSLLDHLDLSYNVLTIVTFNTMVSRSMMRHLNLSGNPLTTALTSDVLSGIFPA
jgi:hypothetical protein